MNTQPYQPAGLNYLKELSMNQSKSTRSQTKRAAAKPEVQQSALGVDFKAELQASLRRAVGSLNEARAARVSVMPHDLANLDKALATLAEELSTFKTLLDQA